MKHYLIVLTSLVTLAFLVSCTSPAATQCPTVFGEMRCDGLFYEGTTIGALQTYSADNGLFSIEVPSNWTMKKINGAHVVWIDPNKNGRIEVVISPQPVKQTQDQLVSFLENFLRDNFGGITIDTPSLEPDGTGPIQTNWSFSEDDIQFNEKIVFDGESVIQQNEDKISIVSVVVWSKQARDLRDQIRDIFRSYEVDSSVAVP